MATLNLNEVEVWKDIPGYENIYMVSSMGRIRSMDHKVRRSDGFWCHKKGKILKTYKDQLGYLRITLLGNKKRRVHQLVLETFIGPRPEGMETRHYNGIRTDNKLSNLSWSTPLTNERDKIRHGKTNRGEKCGKSKLTENQVLDIRKRYEKGDITQKALGEIYSVTGQCIRSIVYRMTWKHI